MSILLVIATLLAAALYAPAWIAALRGSRAERPGAEGAGPETHGAAQAAHAGRLDAVSVWLAGGVVAHAAALFLAIHTPEGFRFGFAQALSATFWVGVALLWFEGLSVRAQALRLLILPVAALCCALPLLFPGIAFAHEGSRPLFLPHLLVGTLAYGVLMLAALHATLMTAAERALHDAGTSHGSLFGRWLEDLPPLLALERILFRFITLGFLLLTLTVLSGVLFSEATFGRPMRFDHKTLFAVIAWGVFGVLLLGRRLRGWRGRTALRLTLAGFMLLLLAYVGSRFVHEVLLQRA